jgi:hypothetical protein
MRKKKIKLLSCDYVSNKENGVGENKGNWVVRPPAWRSVMATELMRKLQHTIESKRQEDVRARVPRISGPPSERGRPRSLVSWAVQASETQSEPRPGKS